MRKNTKVSTISLLSTIGFFGIFSTTISKNPVLPLFMKSMHAQADVIGIIAAISPLAGIIFSFPVGLLADKIGKKKLLIVSAFVFLLSPLLYLMVASPWTLIPIRFFHGIATAILGPVASAIILSEYRENKGEMLGLYSSATLVGRTLAPILGGAIISLFIGLSGNWNYRLVYVGAFLLAIPVFILSFLIASDRSAASGVKKVTLRDFGDSMGTFVTNGRLLGTALVEMATYFTYGAFETYLPLYLQGKGLPPYQIGFIFSLQILAIALTKPFFGRLSDRIDRRVQILAGIIVLGASFALIPVVTGIVAATVIGIVFGMGLSFSTVATSTYVSDVAAHENLGASIGALSSIMDIGQSSGPLVIGAIIQFSTMGTGFFADFAICILSAGLFALLNFRAKTSASAE
jgi:MFS family permease